MHAKRCFNYCERFLLSIIARYQLTLKYGDHTISFGNENDEKINESEVFCCCCGKKTIENSLVRLKNVHSGEIYCNKKTIVVQHSTLDHSTVMPFHHTSWPLSSDGMKQNYCSRDIPLAFTLRFANITHTILNSYRHKRLLRVWICGMGVDTVNKINNIPYLHVYYICALDNIANRKLLQFFFLRQFACKPIRFHLVICIL